ncbi:ribosome recycling factor [Neolentinus lepideus HHB14362 ss-1]|uniref:Ribosome recycling factor n=1 Tax=Neolentinus lepideus HHB14362 ss-1 TaxID=1314782 RepID=A0A165QQ20_9AGAM|nr:ribosome recycling factor [Neolentinus lepideus HHB14362 ss-1]
MSLSRLAVGHARPSLLFSKRTFPASHVLARTYASKAKPKSKSKNDTVDIEDNHLKREKGAVSTSSLVPGSQAIQASEEYTQTQTKMHAAVDWFRKEVAALETRASGRVMPSMLDPVRVTLKNGERVRLDEVATVGVREGSTLVVTVFEEGVSILKFVEQGIYDAKLPSVVPQKQDSRTIRIPIPKPTVEARTALYTSAHRQAEDCRVQIRKHHAAALKKGKFGKRSKELEEFQKLVDKEIGEVDKILTQMKKTLGIR